MGLLIDTDVLILAERKGAVPDFGRFVSHGEAYISVITASELWVGVCRAQDESVRARRTAFVEGILSALPALPIDLEVARLHAQLLAQIPLGEQIGAHDALIGATALRHGFSVLTRNVRDFQRLAGVQVIDYSPAP